MSMEQPTPRNADDWDEADLREHNEETRERLRDALRDEHRLDADEQEALEALRPETKDEQVQLAGTDVRVAVQTHTDREVERAIQRVIEEGESDTPNLGAVRDEMISVIITLIRDGEYQSRELWEAYADEFGITYIYENFQAVAGPVLSRMEAMAQQQSFRQDG